MPFQHTTDLINSSITFKNFWYQRIFTVASTQEPPLSLCLNEHICEACTLKEFKQIVGNHFDVTDEGSACISTFTGEAFFGSHCANIPVLHQDNTFYAIVDVKFEFINSTFQRENGIISASFHAILKEPYSLKVPQNNLILDTSNSKRAQSSTTATATTSSTSSGNKIIWVSDDDDESEAKEDDSTSGDEEDDNIITLVIHNDKKVHKIIWMSDDEEEDELILKKKALKQDLVSADTKPTTKVVPTSSSSSCKQTIVIESDSDSEDVDADYDDNEIENDDIQKLNEDLEHDLKFLRRKLM